MKHDYLQENRCSIEAREYISNLRVYCRKKVPFIHYYREQCFSFNQTVHNILTNEISLILPKLPKISKEKEALLHC